MDDTPTLKLTLTQAVERYLQTVAESSASASHRAHTQRSFAYALRKFLEVVQKRAELSPTTARVTYADPEWVAWFITWLKRQKVAPATERLRLTAVRGFYNFLSAEGVPVNVARVKAIIEQRATPAPVKERHLDPAEVDRLLRWAQEHVVAAHRSPWEKLRTLRDYAFLVLLADTGLRVSEACGLNMDALPRPTASQLKITVTIKGGRESVVRLSPRAWQALRAYHRARAPLDKASGKKPSQLPVFAQHSRLADVKQKRPQGKVSLRRWEDTGVRAMFRAVNRALFPDDAPKPGQRGRLTPHSLRHYFITKIWRQTGDLLLAQKLARHQNIATTQRYAHVDNPTLDQAYGDVFGKRE